MQWRKGKPNAAGLWLVVASTGDLEAWRVEWDQHDPASGIRGRYLRMSDGMDSQPLKDYPWPPRAAFGPIHELSYCGGGSWSRESRPRIDKHPTQRKLRHLYT